MEIRVFKNSNDWAAHKLVLCQRVDSPDGLLFPYDSCVRAFRALYGENCVIDFIVL